ncbi:MAG: hypothetical protein J6Q84_07230 [Kiritimatiellae bacterium]|nr:hypothetical protein [Kiritimatiellia bacterium]
MVNFLKKLLPVLGIIMTFGGNIIAEKVKVQKAEADKQELLKLVEGMIDDKLAK